MNGSKFKIVGGKKMRTGYTTGSCAAAASSAAVKMLLTGRRVEQVTIRLPSGETALFEVTDHRVSEHAAECAVIKDGGDDPDVTSGLRIFARASYAVLGGRDVKISLKGGDGVGVVTRKGLRCDVGEAAINPVPRRMICENAMKAAREEGFSGELDIVIYVPNGEETALKTFNPRLGIEGGISILGTTGIVNPMSEKAIIDTIKLEIDQRYLADPEKILITPGNYGTEFCKDRLSLDIERAVSISNYVGEALDYISYKGFQKILLVGHTGKLIKTAAGVMNTHSSFADGRLEIIAAHAGALGAGADVIERILGCVTTDEAFEIVRDDPWLETLKERITDRSMSHLNFRLRNSAQIEIVMFTTDSGTVLKSRGADVMIDEFRSEYHK